MRGKMIKRSIYFAAVLAALACAISAQNTGTISGTVTIGDKTTLHDADIQITQLRRTVHTDTSGKYTFADVPPGRYTILVHMEGFADSLRVVTVLAGQNTEANFELAIASIKEQVTVTAAGTEQSVFDSFQSVNSVGSTAITERAATGIGDVLQNEPGVAKRSFGPGSSRPVIRGFDGDRVLVLQDGVRSGSLGSQSGDHGEPIDPLAAERIEVVKGPGTLLYGSNALGGVVNVIGHHDDDFHEGARGFLTSVAGTTDNQLGTSGGVEYGVRKWLFRFNGGAQRTSDFNTPIGEIPNSASRSAGFSFGGGYYAEKAFLGASYGYDIRRFGIPYAGEFHHHEEKEKLGDEKEHEEVDIDVRSIRHNLRFTGGFRELTNSFLSGVNYSFDYTKFLQEEIETHEGEGEEEVGTTFNNRTISYRSVFEQQAYKKLTGRFGFEGFNRDYEAVGEEQLIDGPVKQNSFSVFALEELGFEKIRFQFGGRIESNRYRPENPELIDRNFTGFSGGAGVNIPLWSGGAFVFNYTHASRAPALEELYNFGPHIGNLTFEVGDQNLQMERSDGVDFSLRHQSDRFRISGDVYYYNIHDFVYLAYIDENGDGVPDTEDGLPIGLYQQSDATYTGVEISGDVKVNNFVGLYFGFDTVRAKLVDEGLNVPRIPPTRGRLGLDFRYKGLSVRPETIVASRQDNVYPLELPTAGYGIFNIAGSYTIGKQHVAHIFTVNAYNLTNKLYRNHVSYIKELVPEIGRGIRFGYTVRFF